MPASVLAYVYMSMNPYQGLPFEKAHPLMRAAALEAISLDPTLAERTSRGLGACEGVRVGRGGTRLSSGDRAQARARSSATRASPMRCCSRSGAKSRPSSCSAKPSASSARRAGAIRAGTCADRGNRPSDTVAILQPLRTTDSDMLLVDVYLGRAFLFAGRIEEALPLLERRRQRPSSRKRRIPGSRGRMSSSGVAQKRRGSHKSTIVGRCVARSSTGRSGTQIGCSAASRRCSSANRSVSAI